MRSNTQTTIERLYAEPAKPVILSPDMIDDCIREGRKLRAEESARIMRSAFSALWRLVTFSGRQPSGHLKPSNV